MELLIILIIIGVIYVCSTEDKKGKDMVLGKIIMIIGKIIKAMF